MISRGIVEIHRAFGNVESEYVRIKIDVPLWIAGDGGDMMNSAKLHWKQRLTGLAARTQRMYLWRKSASQKWFRFNEAQLRGLAGDQLVIIERSDRKRLQLEIAAKSRAELRTLEDEFGGRIEKLPHGWLKRFLRQKTKPLKVGNRRLIIPAGAAFGEHRCATRVAVADQPAR